MNLFCPIDSKDDTIQKVSAVVASGQATGTFSGPTSGTVAYDGKSGNLNGHTTLSGNSTSQLARLLSPPKEPAKPNGFGCLWLVLWIIPLIVGSIFYSIGGETAQGLIQVVSIVLEFVGIGATFVYLIRMDKAKKAKETIRYEGEKPQWDKAMSRWNRIYYCHKHDIVFDPEIGDSCAPSELKEFLYR